MEVVLWVMMVRLKIDGFRWFYVKFFYCFINVWVVESGFRINVVLIGWEWFGRKDLVLFILSIFSDRFLMVVSFGDIKLFFTILVVDLYIG